jgi:type IV pilus assembly protein PilA
MIVVAIIGILAAIALPAYADYTKRAHVAEGLALAMAAKTGVTEFWAVNGRFPAIDGEHPDISNTSIGLPSAYSIRGNAVSAVELRNGGVIIIIYNEKLESNLAAGQWNWLNLNPSIAHGSLVWKCGKQAAIHQSRMPNKWLPSSCR